MGDLHGCCGSSEWSESARRFRAIGFEPIMVMHVLLGGRVNGQVTKLGSGVCTERRGTLQNSIGYGQLCDDPSTFGRQD